MEQSTLRQQAAAPEALNAPPRTQGSAGSALYVINLCASMAPIPNIDRPLPGFENYRLYQVSRKEDGRIRYRLRLGFFADEAEAETALACIREQYPTAFATSLCDEDQRHTRGYGAAPRTTQAASVPTRVQSASPATAPKDLKAPAAQAATLNAAATAAAKPTSAPTAVTEPSTKPTAVPAAASALSASDTQRVRALRPPVSPVVEVEWEAPQADHTPASVAAASTPTVAASAPPPPVVETVPKPELTLASETVIQPVAATPTAPNQPFHVGKGVEIPLSDLSLAPEPARSSAPNEPAMRSAASAAPETATATKPPAQAIARPAAPPAPKTVSKAAVAAPSKAPARKPTAATPPLKVPTVLGDDVPLPDLDSTQTIRALTAAELDDESQPKWFAVQLAVSEQTINLDTMPHLDIFSAYRLYSVATAGGGKILHHMRIGFFKEQVSADAVCGYLKTFFANPTVLRVSAAEYTRFVEGPKTPAPAAEPAGKVVNLAAARDRTAPAPEVPVVTMEVTPNPSASGRFPKPNTSATGAHKQPPVAAAVRSASATPKPRMPPKAKATSSSGKHKTLNEALLAEAREVELSESAIRRLPKNSSLLSKLFGKK